MTPLAAGAAVVFKLTFYALGCDAPGPLTKAGTHPVAGHTIAADPRVLPIGSIVEIEGLGQRQVHDVGGGVKGRHIDVFMDRCTDARRWGIQRRLVRVLHVPAQVPRRAPGSPGAGVDVDRPARGLAGQERGAARPLVSRTSSQGRVVPAARNLSGDVRPVRRKPSLLLLLGIAVFLGLIAVVALEALLLLFDEEARAELLGDFREWRYRRQLRRMGGRA